MQLYNAYLRPLEILVFYRLVVASHVFHVYGMAKQPAAKQNKERGRTHQTPNLIKCNTIEVQEFILSLGKCLTTVVMTIGVRVVRVRSFDVILYLWMPRACVAFQGFGRPLVPFAARATEQLKDEERSALKKN